MREFVYDADGIEDFIEEILYGYAEYDSDYAELNRYMYAAIFQSDMTDASAAIISEYAEDVSDITDSEFEDWLNSKNDRGTMFYGLPVAYDDGGDLEYYRSAVIFSEPISSIIERYGATDVDEVLSHARIEDDVWFIESSSNPRISACRLDVVNFSHFRY